jgi:hypothetical protein
MISEKTIYTATADKKMENIAREMYLSYSRNRRSARTPQRAVVISNTLELELICARKNLSKELISKAKCLIEKGVDWRIFVEDAVQGRLGYLFYNSLKTINDNSAVPERVLSSLKNESDRVTLSATRQYDQTIQVLRIFSENNIRAVPLKGPILAKRLYGDAAARGSSVDIDIFVEEKDKDTAADLLVRAGYKNHPDSGLGDRLGQHIFWIEKGALVDLHYDLNPVVPSDERARGLLKSIRPKEETGIRYYELSEEELLLQLAVHMADSVFFLQLIYLSDIHELLTAHKDTLNWENIIKNSKKWRISNSLYAALKLCQALLGSPIPADMLSRLKPGPMKRLFIDMFVNKAVLLREGSLRRRFMEQFLKYLFFQILEACSPADYLSMLFPQKKMMGDRTHLQRIVRGIAKIAGVAK